jgi:hypothetical protein
MATIIRETTIEVDPNAAWNALQDYGRVDERLAKGFVMSCRLDEPDVRTLSFINGGVARERLVGLDPNARRLAYTVIESSLDVMHHNAAAQIVADGDVARFVWVTDVLPDRLAPIIAELMERGLEAIKATLEASVPDRRRSVR